VPTVLALIFIFAVATAGRIPFSYVLSGLKPALPVLVLLVILQILFRGQSTQGGTVYFQWWIVNINDAALMAIATGTTRIVAFIFLTSLLTMIMTTTELTHAIESVFGPLQRVGVPVRELALTATIALRFVPTLAEELERVMKAQASRLGEIGLRADWRPDRAARTRLPLIVPLFLTALRRGEDLVLAMEARGYVGGARHNRYRQYHATLIDWLALVVGLAFCAALLILPWPSVPELWARWAALSF
jgi:energy-coupling factor transport system permease protein